MLTQAPPTTLTITELLAKLFEAVNGIRRELHRTDSQGLRILCNNWSVDQWLTDVINSAFNANVGSVAGKKLVIEDQYIEIAQRYLTDDGPFLTAAAPGYGSLVLADPLLEIMRREREVPMQDLRLAYLMDAETFASIKLTNQELLAKLLQALQAWAKDAGVDAPQELTLLARNVSAGMLLKINIEQIFGPASVGVNDKLITLHGVSAQNVSFGKQHVGVHQLVGNTGQFRMAPWVQLILARMERDKMPEAFMA